MTYDRRRRSAEGSDRRRSPRLKPADLPFLKRVEFSKGSKIEIINISRGGLLLETVSRLGPDLKIAVKIVTTEGIFEVEGVTLRSSIFSLKGIPKYRTAIVFKEPFELMDDTEDTSIDEIQENASEVAIPGISETSDSQKSQPELPGNEKEKPPAVLTVVASDENGICLNETFTLNDW
ncbi:MAG: hypothetical protein JXR49_20820 [Acidobacteria bacterium]|nr:hypothetical protein [Acidobacteriota bacterium]